MSEILQPITNAGFSSVNLEAGHFYSDIPLRPIEEQGIKIGVSVAGALNDIGIHVTPIVLVDDFHAPDTHTTPNLLKMSELGFVPARVFKEAEYVDEAMRIFGDIKDRGKVRYRSGKNVHSLRAEGNPDLIKANGDQSCSLLDAAVYSVRHRELGGICLTVLPLTDGSRNYERQQDYVIKILQASGREIPILNVFYNEEGEITVGDFDF